MKKQLSAGLLALIITIFYGIGGIAQPRVPDESGMWLLPQIEGAVHRSMAAKGLALPASAFTTKDGTALNAAIIRINVGEGGGGSGSFISSKGLILTNHHVAYDAIAAASTADVNFLDEGFISKNLNEEIPAENVTLYIPLEQVEVTDQLADAPEQRQARNQIIAERVNGNPDLVAEIDDYWAGNRQFMSVYQVIRDVRIVFAPPSGIGKFGGDIDNWMWPRHTGDFTFLRAYVAPDGTAASYHTENIPYTPVRHLQVSTAGYEDGDFSMVMGFPGSTYRHESSYDFRFYEEAQIPMMIRMLGGILASLEVEASQSPEAAVATASDRASYANSLKYFEGVYKGFNDYEIVKQRQADEERFEKWLKEDIFRETEYSDVMPMLKRGYEQVSEVGDIIFSHVYTLNNSAVLEIAGLFMPAYGVISGEIPSDIFGKEQADSLNITVQEMVADLNLDKEMTLLNHFIVALTELPESKRPAVVDSLFGGSTTASLWMDVEAFLSVQREQSILFNEENRARVLSLESGDIPQDPFVRLYRELLEAYFASLENFQRGSQLMNTANTAYARAMMEFRADSLDYPDANFTLRVSGGRIWPLELLNGRMDPSRTFVEEILPKVSNEEPFTIPAIQADWFRSTEARFRQSASQPVSKYADADGRLVVNFLSTNDITGGNSGSPVMNGKGEVIGVAFDGIIEGVASDYFADPFVNRTISVDIRYVLHVTEELYGLYSLIEELKLP